ncbi:MAG: VOC family protein [Actinomycetota bacterium]|nr:VOC family protein [Actinomycetota bacterium]
MAARIEIGIDSNDPETLALFWARALGYRVGDLDSDGTYLDLVPPAPGHPVVYIQRVVEPKVAKNRLHLDLFVRDAPREIARLESLGATRSGGPVTGSDGGWWQVMADPEGNEFCVCSEEEEGPTEP